VAPAVAVLEVAAQGPVVVLALVAPALAVLAAVVLAPEAAALAVVLVPEVAVQVLAVVLAPEVVQPVALAAEAQVGVQVGVEVVVLAPEAAVLAPEVVQPVALAAEAQVGVEVALRAGAEVEQPPVPAEPVRVAWPVQVPPGRAAAQVAPARPAWAAAERASAPAEAALEAVPLVSARRVRSVQRTLPVLLAPVLPQAVAHPVRRRMGRPRGQPVRRQALGAGRGAASWRPLLVRKCAAPTSCVPCTSGAMPSRAQPIA
jgi:hypothetical protein